MTPSASASTSASTPASSSASSFIHLRLHTEFSVTDGIVRIGDAVAKAALNDMPALAITDISNLFGAVKFYKAASARGVQPIIGCEITIENTKNRDRSSTLLLLCRNQTGYLNLCKLLTRAYRENIWRGHAEIKREWLTPQTCDGFIALSGAAAGDIGKALLEGDSKRALTLAHAWSVCFPAAFYIEIQRADRDSDEVYIAQALNLASVADLPVVATHPIQFCEPDDFKAHEARVCIARGEVLGDKRRSSTFTEAQYFKTSDEMLALFADVPEAIENAIEIAKRCHFTFQLDNPQLPNFPTPNGESANDYLFDTARDGLEKRLAVLYEDKTKRDQVRPDYMARLEFEINTIVRMGFPGYFLIVADFISWAKNNGVPVGPGRGSGAGSLVAYSLGITDLDPIQYDLLFERFLNPDRISMPDFDIDFCQEGRDRVIDYVKNKYGHDSVSQIVTFGTMAAKAVIRDVGRVLGMGYNQVDGIAKLIPNQLGITLSEAIKQEPQFEEKMKLEEEIAELIALALKLEGITRNVGMHAGGVLIAPGPLTDFTPLYVADGSTSFVSQYDKDDVEAVGLVKFDFLGLTTLTVIEETLNFIRTDAAHIDFALERVALDDKASYDIFARGSTVAIFQFESAGMRDLIKKARPTSVEDLTALNALYRPGPMALIPDYIKRKTGEEKVTFLDPRVEPLLSPTCGIMVYQEQVMQIARVIGGYSLGGADLLRRAMGKKKADEMAKHRSIFIEGAEKNGVKASVATELFDFMEKFAGYGFNKSHSAAYSLLAFHTAYLKAHFPAAFMAANMSCIMDFTDKVQLIADDVRAIGLTLLAPDINNGTYRFYPINDITIRYGLGAVKGTGRAAIEAIEAARAAGGEFKNLLDFVKRVDRSKVNRRVMEALIRAGAFDALHINRAALIATLPQAVELADKAERDAQQVNLFGDATPESGGVLALVDVPMYAERERLNNEKLALGFYLSGHPFTSYAREIRQFAGTLLADLQPKNEAILLAGILYEQRVRNGKRGRMCVMTLDDGSARAEMVAYNEVFEKRRAMLRDDEPLIVRGLVSHDDFSGGNKVTVEDVISIDEARKFVRLVTLSMNGQADSARLKRIISPHVVPQSDAQSSAAHIKIIYNNGDAEVQTTLPDQWRIRVTEAVVNDLIDFVGADNVTLNYDASHMMPAAPRRNWRDKFQSQYSGAGEY